MGGLDKAKPGKLYLDETVSRMVTTMRSALIDLASNLSNEGTMAKAGNLAIPACMTQEAYVADRYKKARHILDLMLEKLPTSVCPFTVQMGEQIADIYYNLGMASGDNECVKKGKEILDSEILRYAGYLRFYQSLDASQYDRLTNLDKFIDQQYMLYMLNGYGERYGEDAYQKIMGELQAKGVNDAIERAHARSLRPIFNLGYITLRRPDPAGQLRLGHLLSLANIPKDLPGVKGIRLFLGLHAFRRSGGTEFRVKDYVVISNLVIIYVFCHNILPLFVLLFLSRCEESFGSSSESH